MSSKKSGFSFGDSIKQVLRKINLAEKRTNDAMVKAITQLVERFKKEAIRRVPLDTGAMEQSFSVKIVTAIGKNGPEISGEVFVADNAPAIDYAMWLHEWDYNLGPRSLEKQATVGVEVGRKYLERALTENEREFGLFIYGKLMGTLR